ncbi:Uncharacterised protein [Mycobacteroides abscessus]|nr:Uncharacterised protein [Mycobacteroides abscessus]
MPPNIATSSAVFEPSAPVNRPDAGTPFSMNAW